VWEKPNGMPSSVTDRFTVNFEYLYFFVKNTKYYFEQQLEPFKQSSIERLKRAVSNRNKWSNIQGLNKERNNLNTKIPIEDCENYGSPMVAKFNIDKGKNMRAIWKIPTAGFSENHFAVFPEKLCVIPIKAGSKKKDVVLDPFFGSGTVGVVSEKLNRRWIGIELNSEYCEIAKNRIEKYRKQMNFKF
jgi:DNA modification methylase